MRITSLLILAASLTVPAFSLPTLPLVFTDPLASADPADVIGDPSAPAVALSVGSGATPAIASRSAATLAIPSAILTESALSYFGICLLYTSDAADE